VRDLPVTRMRGPTTASEAQGDATTRVERRVATPVAGAIAGILFAVLFGVSVTLIRSTVADLAHDTGDWLHTGAGELKFALALVPFAGLFFLWFIAVARDRLGRFEDQFFSTVFIGSGLLFLAMMFAAAASAGAIAAAYAKDPSAFAASSTYLYARQMIAQIFNTYALRMAAVFLISQATLWLRTGVMPRWMALLTYPLALVLLFVVTQASWVILVFPGWVFLVSVYILVVNLRRQEADGDESVSAEQGGASA
jgi:phage shock protein PspC (stress-responsive transcriptional regulator)